MDPQVPSAWLEYATKFGVPSFVAVGVYYLAPKVWKFFQQRFNISSQTNDLTQAGLSGVNEVVQTLRNQISDMTTQLQGFQNKLKEMSVTLDQAMTDKVVAQQSAAQAKSDLFDLQLYVQRLKAQIKSLNTVPLDP